jgi:small nuclear ribonucleoprotein (snRNP)-like protein
MSDPTSEKDELAEFVGEQVVLDTRGELIYIGTLAAVRDWFLELGQADVHDLQSTRTSKELYIMESAKHGVRTNREKVLVRKSEVVSLSKLSDVTRY